MGKFTSYIYLNGLLERMMGGEFFPDRIFLLFE